MSASAFTTSSGSSAEPACRATCRDPSAGPAPPAALPADTALGLLVHVSRPYDRLARAASSAVNVSAPLSSASMSTPARHVSPGARMCCSGAGPTVRDECPRLILYMPRGIYVYMRHIRGSKQHRWDLAYERTEPARVQAAVGAQRIQLVRRALSQYLHVKSAEVRAASRVSRASRASRAAVAG